MSDRAVDAAAQALAQSDNDASYADVRRAVEAAEPILRARWVAEVQGALKGLTAKSDYDDECWLDSEEVMAAVAALGVRSDTEDRP